MKRTISVMVGKGSVSHNSRKFNAKNTDPERTQFNREYCNEDIRKVYHELFDDALRAYNEKQTRRDRVIEDYYEKIRRGKQEKPFHEVILQIGSRDDTGATSDNGKLAECVLDEYMHGFQERNPNLRVFSAHLHMDEATPHLHIDFIPFITGSKRGLETRVSLKQALASQGFRGGTRGDTEWNQWVYSEKQQLAKVMERHSIEWEQKGTHEKHLSVLDYEKKMRTQEVDLLTKTIEEKEIELGAVGYSIKRAQSELEKLQGDESLIKSEMRQYDMDEWSLPPVTAFMSARSYRDKVYDLVMKFKSAMFAAISKYNDLMNKIKSIQRQLYAAESRVSNLTDRVRDEMQYSKRLEGEVKEYRFLRRFLGEKKTDDILQQARESHKQRTKEKYEYER